MKTEIPHHSPSRGTIARVAISCDTPEGKRASWLYTGDDHRDESARVSPFCADCLEVFQWAKENHWVGVADAYVYTPLPRVENLRVFSH
jgi:hypothetical protein